MKKCVVLLLLTALLLWAATAFADTYYVYTENGKGLNLRSPKDNSVIGVIPYGTRLETDDSRSTETAAFVTYKGKSGFVKWQFLVKDPPPAKSGASGIAPAATQPPAAQALPADGEGAITIQAVGASITYVFSGGSYSAVSYDIPQTLEIRAYKKPAYWVINGVQYDFEDAVPESLIVSGARSSMTFEAVPKNTASATLLSAEDIQALRTGETLMVSTLQSKLCHVRAKGSGAGGWMTEFDFTDDYINRATNSWERGGQVSFRVRADIPKGKKISYWKFNEAKIDFSANVTQFLVHGLNVSMIYEPVFDGSVETETVTPTPDRGGTPSRITSKPSPTPTPDRGGTPSRITSKPSPTPTPNRGGTPIRITPTPTLQRGNIDNLVTRPTATPTPRRYGVGTIVVTPTPSPRSVSIGGTVSRATINPAQRVTKYSVSCTNCTFSGGGYTNATSGSVAEGTVITVTANGPVSKWYYNGGTKVLSRAGDLDTRTSFTVTVSTNTTLNAVLK